MGTYPKTLGKAVTHDDVVYYIEKEFAGTEAAAANASAMLAADDLPDAAGTYVLTCTVTEGDDDSLEYEYSWESLGE